MCINRYGREEVTHLRPDVGLGLERVMARVVHELGVVGSGRCPWQENGGPNGLELDDYDLLS